MWPHCLPPIISRVSHGGAAAPNDTVDPRSPAAAAASPRTRPSARLLTLRARPSALSYAAASAAICAFPRAAIATFEASSASASAAASAAWLFLVPFLTAALHTSARFLAPQAVPALRSRRSPAAGRGGLKSLFLPPQWAPFPLPCAASVQVLQARVAPVPPNSAEAHDS